MTFVSYNLSIPAAANNPSADQPLMQTNTNSINTIFGQDHISFNLTNGGIHKQVNMTNQSSPARVSDTVIYSRTAGGQSSIWVKNSSQDLPLFTGTASGIANGYTSMFGGIIIEWGSATGGTVTFPLTFPNNLFSIQITLVGSSGAIASAVHTSSTSGFTYFPTLGTINWVAIGN